MRFLFLLLAMSFTFAAHADAHMDDEIRERLKPFGSVCIAGQECPTADALRQRQSAGAQASETPSPTVAEATVAVAAAPMAGSEVYAKFCFTCHDAAVAGAPLVHDSEQWASRVAKGMDVMIQTTVSGMNAMPPKGMCMACSDDELRDAIDFMTGEAP